MKEYSILCIYNGGRPFYLQNYHSFEDAKVSLYNILDIEIERNRPYYVDNDFFKNVYPANLQRMKYFCIKERDVTEWVSVVKNDTRKNNIIYFNKSC